MNIEEQISKSLGSENSYAVSTTQFDSTLLNALSRSELRKTYGITGEEFVGFDVWHCHEATFLLNNGYPIAGTLKIIIPASTENIVESKSFKLYLNSFDMCKMGETVMDAVRNYESQIHNDLIRILGLKLDTNVQVKFFDLSHFSFLRYDSSADYEYSNYEFINANIDGEPITDYTGKENHLKFEVGTTNHHYCYYTNVLRSRCRHTKQKDTGNAFVLYSTKNGYWLPAESVLRQIISMREVNEFHEFCAEKFFMDMMNTGYIKNLAVQFLYTRRGSLDINPLRGTDVKFLFKNLLNINKLSFKQLNQ